jgi:TPP-dependent pyruvate/acetoin dehydrogenase alpha subunit
VGALPAIAVVGASAPIALGFAFASKYRDAGRVALTFFGEGAAAKGEIHEAMGLAAVWDLPVIFLCENNLYAVSTPQTGSMKNERVSERAQAYRMAGITVDGNDPIAVYNAVTEAARVARLGEGPSLVECLTYRHGGHKRDDAATYRPEKEVTAWLARDPIPAFRGRLLEDGRITETELDSTDADVAAVVQQAASTAQASPYPDPAGLLEEAYV